MNNGFDLLPRDLARLRSAGRLVMSRSPITGRWRIRIVEAGYDNEAPNRHLLYDGARAAAQRVGLL
jgi:hypothetical protein